MTTARVRTLKAGLAALIVTMSAHPAASGPADGWTTVSSTYGVSLAGLDVAALNLEATFNNHSYRLSGSGRVTGIASVISSTQGSTRSSGLFSGSRALPNAFYHSESSRETTISIAMDMRAGDVKRVAVSPDMEDDPKRIPVQNTHLRSVLDPFSAIIVRVPGEGPLVSERACARSIPIYNGWHRFDVALTFVGVRESQSEQGYRGPVVVCEARYRPISGYRPFKASVQRAQETRVEIWLAPVEGTRVLLPYRAALDTTLGRVVLQARKFDISKGQRRAAAQ